MKKNICPTSNKGKTTDKKHRFQPKVIKRYKLRIETLEDAASVDDLYQINSLHYEVLKGAKKGISSIRVNDLYRIEFTTSKVEGYIPNCRTMSFPRRRESRNNPYAFT